jgi:L-amino acid N-acyltransferase YncA
MAVGGIVRELVNRITFKTDSTGAKIAEGHFNKLQGLAGKLSILGTGLFSGFTLKGMFSGLVNVNELFDESHRAFKAMLNDETQANELMKQLTQTAKENRFLTPKEIFDSGKALLGYGDDVTKVTEHIKMIGNVAAGIGKESLEPLVQIFGRTNAATLNMPRNIMRLRAAGFDLAKAMGLTNEELEKLITNKTIKFTDIENAFKKVTSSGGGFYNMMIDKSKNLPEVWKAFKTGFLFDLLDVSKQLVPYLEKIGGWFLKIFDYLNSKISPTMKAILFAISAVTLAAVTLASAIMLINVELLPIYGIILAIMAGLALIGALVEDIIIYFKGGKSLIGEWLPSVIKFKKSLSDVNDILGLTGKAVSDVQFGKWEAFRKDLENIKNIFNDLINNKAFRWITGITGLETIANQLRGGTREDYNKRIDVEYFTKKYANSPILAKAYNTSRNNVTMNTHINMSLPVGTSEQQVGYIKWNAEKIFKEHLDKHARQIIASNKVKE